MQVNIPVPWRAYGTEKSSEIEHSIQEQKGGLKTDLDVKT